MRSDPIVSVIIPCFNVSKYIERCVQSISCDRNFKSYEIICVDDGSTDKTWDVLQSLSSVYSNLRIYQQSNKGQSAARNFALQLARGDYIGFVDADDSVSENYFSCLLECAKDDDVDVIFARMSSIGSNGLIDHKNGRPYHIDDFKSIAISSDSDRGALLALFLSDRISVSPCNKLIKAELIRNVGFFTEGLFNEDMEYAFKLILNLKRIAKCNDAFYYYWYNPESTTKRTDLRVLDMLVIVRKIINMIPACYATKLKSQMYGYVLLNSIYVTYCRIKCANRMIRQVVLRELQLELKKIPLSYYFTDQNTTRKRLVLFLMIRTFGAALA